MKFSDLDLTGKNVYILSHFRSGSSWFARCFKHHYIVGEILHPWLNIRSVTDTQFVYERPDFNNQIDVLDRFKMIDMITNNRNIVSKTHTKCLSDNVIYDFLHKKSLDKNKNIFIMVERKDKFKSFVSHIVSIKENSWNSFQDQFIKENTTIEIPQDMVKLVLDELEDFENKKQTVLENFSAYHYYYEDLLLEAENQFWSPGHSHLTIQNKIDRYELINQAEILDWINNSSYRYKDLIHSKMMEHFNIQ